MTDLKVSNKLRSLVSVLAVVGLGYSIAVANPQDETESEFELASVRFEQNVTDRDMEVVFEAKSGDEGLVKLTVTSSDRRKVIDFTAPDVSFSGIRQFVFESPEPENVESLKTAYPEGEYIFSGVTASGVKLHSESVLSHQLPTTVMLIKPANDAKDVDINDFKIIWTSGKDVAAFIVEIEQDDLAVSLKAKLPGTVTTFGVPDGFLIPDTEYELSIGTVNEEGNISYIETTFTTAGKV